MVKEGVINDNLETEKEELGKALLTEELELYEKAKLEELIVEPIAVLTLKDCDETALTDTNIKEVVDKVRTEAKDTREAVMKDRKKNDNMTRELERVQLRSQLKEEKLSLLITKINMGDSKEKISYKLAEKARGKLIDAAKSCYPADYNAQLNTPEDTTKYKYLNIHSIITAETIVAMGREVKQENGIKTIPIILTVSTEHQKETVRDLARDASLGAKNTMPKICLKQKADTFIKGLPEMTGMWVKTDILLGREEHAPMFRIQ